MPETPTQRRHRAPAMSTADRREAIIKAALPLLAEHGMKVTTAQIANAAHIAEGTVFRVFKDKQELIDACVWSALQGDESRARIATVPTDQPIADRMIGGLLPLTEHWQQIGTLMHTLATGGYQPDRSRFTKQDGNQEHPMAEEFTKTVAAFGELIDTGDEKLRIPSERVARYLICAMFADRMNVHENKSEETREKTTTEIVDLFLYGAIDRNYQEGENNE